VTSNEEVDMSESQPLHHEERFTETHWSTLLESIDLSIAQEAIICHVPLLEEGVMERVLKRDALVCGHANPAAFEKLRSLLIMHFSARNQMALELGEEETTAIASSVREHLRGRVGDQLGTPPG
jgi:hypothetical protein